MLPGVAGNAALIYAGASKRLFRYRFTDRAEVAGFQ